MKTPDLLIEPVIGPISGSVTRSVTRSMLGLMIGLGLATHSQNALAARGKLAAGQMIVKHLQSAPTVNAILKSSKAHLSTTDFDFLESKAKRLNAIERELFINHKLVNKHKLVLTLGMLHISIESKADHPNKIFINDKPIQLEPRRTLADIWSEIERQIPEATKISHHRQSLWLPQAQAENWIGMAGIGMIAIVGSLAANDWLKTSEEDTSDNFFARAWNDIKNLFRQPASEKP